MNTRRFAAPLAAVALAALSLGLNMPHAASAQEWPTRTITVVVPLAAGSASDIMARVVMEQVGRQLNRTIIVENRPGAGGTIGANLVAKAAPDGATMLVYGALSTAHALYSKLPYDTLNDLIPVIPFGQQPLMVVTSPAKGYKNLGDLVSAAKARPGTFNYSTAGIGSASHFGAERLRMSAGIEAQNIAFRGAAEAVTEAVAGRVDFSVQPFLTTLSLLNDGKLVALAISAKQRSRLVPNVPTTIEAGLRDDSVYPFWSGLFMPAKTPPELIDLLHRETAKALQAPAVMAQMQKIGVEPMPMSAEQFAKFFREDVESNLALVTNAKIPRQ